MVICRLLIFAAFKSPATRTCQVSFRCLSMKEVVLSTDREMFCEGNNLPTSRPYTRMQLVYKCMVCFVVNRFFAKVMAYRYVACGGTLCAFLLSF